MKILFEINNQTFPLTWVNLDFYLESKGSKCEVYLHDNENSVDELICMFHNLFQDVIGNLKVYNHSWWDYCLDTWDPIRDNYNYELEGKSIETKDYLRMLNESSIEEDFSGICECNNWDKFLSITLNCIITHKAPYSPVFYDEKNDFFFYFHHTGSIGFYYRDQNEVVVKLLNIAKEKYDVR